MRLNFVVIGTLASVAVGLGLTSCSRDLTPAAFYQTNSESIPEMTFSDWCSAWNLHCEPSQPTVKSPFSLQQVKSGLKLTDTFFRSGSHLSISASDLNSNSLSEAFDLFLQGKVLRQTSQKLKNLGFSKASLDGSGVAQFSFATSAPYVGPSGLSWALGTDAGVSFGLDGWVNVSGVSMSGADAANIAKVVRVQPLTAETFLLETDAFVVRDVPLWFVATEVFQGIDDVSVGEIPSKNLAMGLNRLLDWFTSTNQSIKVDRNFLSELGREYDVMVPRPKVSKYWFESFRKIISRIDGVSLTVGKGEMEIRGHLQGTGNLFCNIEGAPVAIELKKDFLITMPVQTAADRVVMRFQGIASKLDLPGPRDPGFDLSTIEYTGEKIIFRGVPLVGSFGVDADPARAEKMDLRCQ
jgi:hypothetical protein